MAARAVKEPDPPTQLRELERALDGSGLPRAIVVRGDERWFRESAIKSVSQAAAKLSMEIVRHDVHDPDFSKSALGADLSAPPMFSSSRLIIVRNSASLFAPSAEQPDPPMLRSAQAFLADTANPGCLLLDGQGLRADSRIVKAIVQVDGRVLSLRRLYDTPAAWNPDSSQTELVRWLAERARARNVKLSAEDAVYIAAATGNDLSALDNALGRIAERGRQSVRELVLWSSGGSPFETAEHMCRGDAAKAVRGIESFFRHGFHDKSGGHVLDGAGLFVILVGSLRSKLRQAVTGALALERGASLAEAADRLKVPKVAAARQEFESRSRERSSAEWRQMLLDVIDLERSSRSGTKPDAADAVRLALRWRRDPRTRR